MERKASETLGVLELIAAMSLAGSSVPVGKLLSLSVPPCTAAFLSLAFACVVLVPLQLPRAKELLSLELRDFAHMVPQALFGIVLFRIFTLLGLRITSSSHAALITAATPAVLALVSFIFLGERPGPLRISAVAVVSGGLVLLGLDGAGTGRGGAVSLAGDGLVFLAVVSEALLTIFRKRSGGRVGAVTNTSVLVLVSALLFAPLAAMEGRFFSLASIPPEAWLALAYYGGIATVGAYILWGDGALRIPGWKTGIACVAMPISALVISTGILGERPGRGVLAAAPILIVGLVLAAWPQGGGRSGAAATPRA